MFQTNSNLKSYFVYLKEKHNFHLVANSQLPIVVALTSMLLVLNIVFYLHFFDLSMIHFYDNMNFQMAWFIFLTVLFSWFLIVVFESAQGYHTLIVRQGLRYGMILFIVSEIMFFFAFFWGFFHVSLSPSVAIGGIWPPKSIQALDVWGLPLVNTLLLLSSGLTITLAHRALLQSLNDYRHSNVSQDLTPMETPFFTVFQQHLATTIAFGVIFLICQGIEYKYGITFRWKENVYGSTFFVTTGFHGLHVTIGTIFLLFCLLRDIMTTGYFWTLLEESRQQTLRWALNETYEYWKFILLLGIFEGPESQLRGRRTIEYEYGRTSYRWKKINDPTKRRCQKWWTERLKNVMEPYKMTKDQHLGFEAAAWYWHFVDVVWIFLFITIYWWGS